MLVELRQISLLTDLERLLAAQDDGMFDPRRLPKARCAAPIVQVGTLLSPLLFQRNNSRFDCRGGVWPACILGIGKVLYVREY